MKQTLGEDEVIDLVNRMNAKWIAPARRLSPRVIVDLLEWSSPQVHEHLASLDPFAEAAVGVSWAGEATSANWFDIAREYTERWHHQQQIRDAAGCEPLTDRRFLFPALDTFVRGLPHAYRMAPAPDGTEVVVSLTGPAGNAPASKATPP